MGGGVSESQPAPSAWKYTIPVALLAALGLTVTLGVVQMQRHAATEAADHVVDHSVSVTAERATQSLAILTGSLGAVGSWFAVDEQVTESDFRTFVKQMLRDRSDVQAVQFAPRVPASERSRLEAQLTAEGHTGRITAPSTQGLGVAPRRRQYLPIVFSYPRAGNEVAYGLDLLARPETKTTIRLARTTGRTQVGPLIRLVEDNSPALLLYTPLFRSDRSSAHGPMRAAAWDGVTVAVLRLDDWMSSARDGISADEVDLTLVDRRQGSDQILWSNQDGADPNGRAWTRMARVDLGAGEQFELLGRPTGRLVAAQGHWRPWVALGAGLLMTALLCLAVWKWLDARRIRRTADDLQRASNRLRFLAERDPLTGLPHRDGLRSWFEDWATSNPDRSLAALFIDLDGFKEVNSTWGHPTGDLVLRQIGQRLAILSGDPDSTVARLSGDEFVVVRAMDRGSLEGLTTMVQTLIGEPIPVGDRDVQLTSSVGIAVRPEDGNTLDTLLTNADIAVRAAKLQPADSVVRFDPVMAAQSAAQRQLARALRVAMRHPEDGFFLEYQPQIDMRTGSVVAAEALVRWRDNTGRLIPPLDFLLPARAHGLMPRLGAWILEQACATVADWQSSCDPVVAVNVDTAQLGDDFAGLLSSVLFRHQLSPDRLVVEVTEGATMDEDAQRELDRIRALGVSIAIDDFGTGFSSLSRLVDLPNQQLKIDQVFVAGLGESAPSLEIVRSIVALARALGLEVLAEGVETPRQAEVLLAEGVHMAQGFLFARPLSADQCLQMWHT
ncbi:MAG TPA: EAL domain-containing protein, partial [Actinomycetota bacterium]|nr:EAL domain-containing protein [Actinomycetota bacterium]